MEIRARNVNGMLEDALWWLKTAGVKENSRNGPVIVSPEPVLLDYEKSTERVLFSETRDANPWLHLFESIYFLHGGRNLDWITQFNSRFHEFSDDGKILHGAYGYRWRKWFKFDQLATIAKHLKNQPNSRRAVLTMWSPRGDLIPNRKGEGGLSSKDTPCNVVVFFDRRDNRLNMTVCNRSNDCLFGALGANSVQFSILQEYLASWIGVRVGIYRQFSHNFHVYTKLKGYPSCDPVEIGCEDRYEEGVVHPVPLIQDTVAAFDTDLKLFMSDPLSDVDYHDPFFNEVAAPMYASWHERKTKVNTGLSAAQSIKASDWRRACVEWIQRRERKAKNV